MIKSTLCYIEKSGNILMMLRGKKPEDPNAGKWIGIGGKFLPGEEPDACMLREVKEETGLVLPAWHFHGVIKFRSDAWEYEDMYLYSAMLPDDYQIPDMVCDEGELAWIEKEKISELPLWEGDRLFLRELLAGAKAINMNLKYEGDRLVSHESYAPETAHPAGE